MASKANLLGQQEQAKNAAAKGAAAKGAAAKGAAHIKRQREIIEELEQDGHETTAAQALLRASLETQALHEQDLARITKELEQ